MAKKYTWKINALDAHVEHESKNDVVYIVHWGYQCSETVSGKEYIKENIGTHSVDFDSENFIEYSDLKESDVIGWLESGLDVDAMKSSLASQLDLEVTPVMKTFRDPFAESE